MIPFLSKYALDIRSISLMRIGLALVALVDLGIRASDLTAHYTNQGILPLDVLFQSLWNEYWFSLYTVGSSSWVIAVVMLLHASILVSLLLGYKTRYATILAWIFTISIQNRNPLINQGGDDLLRLLLFWGIFLPWGTYFSIDARSNPTKEQPIKYLSMAGLGYVLLVISVYFFSALLKNGDDWTKNYSAVYYTLHLDMITYPWARYLLNYPALLKGFTIVVYYYELLAPILLFIPFYVARMRWIFIISTYLLHVGFMAMLLVGIFPLVSIAALVGLIPSSFWKSSDAAQPILVSDFQYYLKEFSITLIVAFSLYVNIYNVSVYKIDVVEKLRPISHFFRQEQNWGMFAPIVFRDDGWFIFKSTIRAKEVDLYTNGKPVNYSKPYSVVGMVKNDRWRKYQENMLFIHNSHLRTYYCNWIVRDWNTRHLPAEQVASVELIYMKEVTLPEGQKMDIVREKL